MKIKNLVIAVSIMTALILVIILNQKKALAQPPPVDDYCVVEFIVDQNSKIDKVEQESCGSCTMYKINSDWEEGDSPAVKYLIYEASFGATVVSCKSAQVSTSCANYFIKRIDCPEPPEDLFPDDTGTNNSTGTGY